MKHSRCSRNAFLAAFFWGFSTLALAQNGATDESAAYTLPHTEVRTLSSEITGVDYVLYISLPRNYNTAGERYPVVYTLDADYAFALTHNIVEHFVDRRNLPPMMVVSIAYPGASQDIPVYRRNRTRDYTPTHTLEGGYGPAFQKYSGGGEKFREFIAQELQPFTEKNYYADPRDRTFVGHSYGGLFGSFVLISKPEMFQRYILVSPSLWYDNKVIFEMENKFAAQRDNLHARVFLGVGSYENQPQHGRAMVDDLMALEAALNAHNYSDLHINSHVFPDETHNSVFPSALTRGLRVVFSDQD